MNQGAAGIVSLHNSLAYMSLFKVAVMKCLEQKAYYIILLPSELRELGAMSREPRMSSVSLSGSIFPPFTVTKHSNL